MKHPLLWLFLVLLLAPGWSEKVAILIGCNEYANFPKLKCCVADVKSMRETLTATGYHVYAMTDEALNEEGKPNIARFYPSKTNIERQLGIWAPEGAFGAKDTLLFFFSGHGARSLDGHDYLAPLDGQFKAEGGADFTSLVTIDAVYETLRRSGAENLLIITDACRNEPGRGIAQAGSFGKGAENAVKSTQWGDQRVVLLRSCKEEQRSFEMPDGAGGYFTHFLTRGLAGEAGQDGKVTAAGLCAYVKEQVRKKVAEQENEVQIPQFTFTDADPGAIVLADKVPPPGQLVLKLTAPDELARGQELTIDGDAVTVTGLVTDAPGVQVTVDTGGDVPLREASKDLVALRPFTFSLTKLAAGVTTVTFTAHDAAGHTAQWLSRIRRQPKAPLAGGEKINPPEGAAILPPATTSPTGKKRIAVLDFSVPAAAVDIQNYQDVDNQATHGISETMTDMLITALMKAGIFEIVERAQLSRVLEEHHLGASGEVAPVLAAEAGKILGVEYILGGKVTQFAMKVTEISTPFGKVGTQTANVGIDVRMVNATTAAIDSVASGKGSQSKAGVSMELNGQSFAVDNKEWLKGMLGDTTRKAVDEVVKDILKQIPVTVLGVDQKMIYISAGRLQGLKKGDQFNVVQITRKLDENGAVMFEKETVIGKAKVTNVNDNKSECEFTVLGTDTPKAGDKVTPMAK